MVRGHMGLKMLLAIVVAAPYSWQEFWPPGTQPRLGTLGESG